MEGESHGGGSYWSPDPRFRNSASAISISLSCAMSCSFSAGSISGSTSTARGSNGSCPERRRSSAACSGGVGGAREVRHLDVSAWRGNADQFRTSHLLRWKSGAAKHFLPRRRQMSSHPANVIWCCTLMVSLRTTWDARCVARSRDLLVAAVDDGSVVDR